MKRLFFVLVIIVSSFATCFGQLKAEDLNKSKVQRELLKEYCVCICITEGFKDRQIENDDISQSVYSDILRYSPEALQEVRNYAKKYVEAIKPSPIEDLGKKKAIILSCLEQLKSKELSKFIKSLDKYLLHE